MFTLPQLNYDFDALEPYIDAKTMEIHYSKHHQTYVDKLNETLSNYPELANLGVEDLLSKIDSVPDEIKTKVINFAGGHSNHSFFWNMLTPQKQEIPEWFLKYKDEFVSKSLSLFGSGWVWLCDDGGNLSVMQTPNQDSPVMKGLKPILGIDLWEHAYYLKYQNRRSEYVENFFNVVDWGKIEVESSK